MSYKIGLEVEFFAISKGKIVDASTSGLPHDEFPLLVEARGEPAQCPFKAVGSVRAEIARIRSLMKVSKLSPLMQNWVDKDDHYKVLAEAVQRRGIHKQISWENIHGSGLSKKNETHLAAGMHVSFTKSSSFRYVDSDKREQAHSYNQLFDFSKLFRGIENEFGKEIDASERVRGFYELKPDGRIEYRSLPTTLILGRDFEERLSRAITPHLN
jgi:hypothetical protein